MKSRKNIQLIVVILVLIVLFFVIGCGEDEKVLEEKITTGILTCVVKNASTEKGVEGALVTVDEKTSATTDATGTATIELALGKHDIKVTAKGYIEAGQTVTIRHEGIKVSILLTPGVRVKGLVTSDVGNPIAGVRVTLGNYSRFTDNLGQFTLWYRRGKHRHLFNSSG